MQGNLLTPLAFLPDGGPRGEGTHMTTKPDYFPTETGSLPEARATESVELASGAHDPAVGLCSDCRVAPILATYARPGA
jgi:hypothetical protein